MSKNPFRKPEQKPGPRRRYFVSYEVSSEVEAESEDEAREIAARQIADDVNENHIDVRPVGAAESLRYMGPAAWREAIEATGRGEDFDRMTSDGWLTDGRCAIQIPTGTDLGPLGEVRVSSADVIGTVSDDRVMPVERVVGALSEDGHEQDLVRVGSAWFQERYLWLVAEVLGEVEWRSATRSGWNGTVSLLVAYRLGEAVAVVAEARNTGWLREVAKPFEACT
jgi:hypothetical protein